jgi:hypothetical protein
VALSLQLPTTVKSWPLIFGLLLPLASCARTQAPFPALASVNRIEAKSIGLKSPYPRLAKTITNPAQVARIVALLDAQKSNWKEYSDGPRTGNRSIELTLTAGATPQRELAVHPSGVLGSMGGSWNLSARQSNGGFWLSKEVPDADLDALIAAIGPIPVARSPSPHPGKNK